MTEEELSLHEKLTKAESLLDDEHHPSNTNKNPIETAIKLLTNLQISFHQESLVSSNNKNNSSETLDDVTTSTLPLLSIDYHLARAILQLPTKNGTERRANVTRASECFHGFVSRCEAIEGLLEEGVVRDYHLCLDVLDQNLGEDAGAHGQSQSHGSAEERRMAKIARYKYAQNLKSKLQQLTAVEQRRNRLNLTEDELLDGTDGEGLRRSLTILRLNLYSSDAISELYGCRREEEVLEMVIKMEEERRTATLHRGGDDGQDQRDGRPGRHADEKGGVQYRPFGTNATKPLQVTKIDRDAAGQLRVKREEVRSTVFRPGWNQPTMTLAQLGERERKEAIDREERQKRNEEMDRDKPRRYEQLVRDGMEDSADLVDKSARLDRDWDDWKDENPRGSGNKLGDRGDRNF